MPIEVRFIGAIDLRFLPFRVTVFRLSLALAITAIFMSFAIEPIRDRRERLLSIADRYATSAAEYQSSGTRCQGQLRADLLRIGAWHRHMADQYEFAADRLWITPPPIMMFPPKGWNPPAAINLSQQ